MIRSGYEFWTGITNILIFGMSLYSYLNVKDKNWRVFFFLIYIDGLMGTIIHTFNWNSETTNFLWIILSFFFSITINQLLLIFIDNKKLNFKHSFLISIILYLIFFIEILLKIEFLYTFIIYASLVFIYGFYISIKNKNKYVLLGLLFQLIGGLLLIFRVKFLILDYNGIYHMFMVMTIISFYLYNKKVITE